MAKVGHRSAFGQLFVHGLRTLSMNLIWVIGVLVCRSKSICHFNFDLNPVCKTCSWNLFQVSKNVLKKCVSEIAALLQSQGEVGSAPLGQSTPPQIPCACTLPDLRLSLCWIDLHSFLPCFSLLGNFTKVRSPSDYIQCPGIVEIDQDPLLSCWWTVALWMLPHGFF